MPGPYFDAAFAGTEAEDNATYFGTVAAAYVQNVAPVPDPEPDDYADLAAAAEYMIYKYLVRTSGGSLKSQSARGLSASYGDIGAVEALIPSVMGEYYEGPESASHNTGYTEDYS